MDTRRSEFLQGSLFGCAAGAVICLGLLFALESKKPFSKPATVDKPEPEIRVVEKVVEKVVEVEKKVPPPKLSAVEVAGAVADKDNVYFGLMGVKPEGYDLVFVDLNKGPNTGMMVWITSRGHDFHDVFIRGRSEPKFHKLLTQLLAKLSPESSEETILQFVQLGMNKLANQKTHATRLGNLIVVFENKNEPQPYQVSMAFWPGNEKTPSAR